jgi:hypothetical protein
MTTVASDMNLSESRGTEINVIAWVFTGIAIATVSLKLFARAQSANRLGWDDFFIFFSLVSKAKRLASENKNMDMTDIIPQGPQHHCCCVCITLGHAWSGSTHSGSNRRLWY